MDPHPSTRLGANPHDTPCDTRVQQRRRPSQKTSARVVVARSVRPPWRQIKHRRHEKRPGRSVRAWASAAREASGGPADRSVRRRSVRAPWWAGDRRSGVGVVGRDARPGVGTVVGVGREGASGRGHRRGRIEGPAWAWGGPPRTGRGVVGHEEHLGHRHRIEAFGVASWAREAFGVGGTRSGERASASAAREASGRGPQRGRRIESSAAVGGARSAFARAPRPTQRRDDESPHQNISAESR